MTQTIIGDRPGQAGGAARRRRAAFIVAGLLPETLSVHCAVCGVLVMPPCAEAVDHQIVRAAGGQGKGRRRAGAGVAAGLVKVVL